MTHELKDCGLFGLLRHRADVELAFLREAMRRNDELNERFKSLNDELDRLCDLVQPGIMQTGRQDSESATEDGISDGQRQAIERRGDDVCGMEHEVRATCPGYKLGNKSHGFTDSNGPRPRTPIPFAGNYM